MTAFVLITNDCNRKTANNTLLSTSYVVNELLILQFLKSSQESFSLIPQRRSPGRQQLSGPDKLEPPWRVSGTPKETEETTALPAWCEQLSWAPRLGSDIPWAWNNLTPVPSRHSLPHWISQPQEWAAGAQRDPKRHTGCVKLIIWGEKKEIHQTNLTLFLFFQIRFQPAHAWQWLPGAPILWPTRSLRNGYHFTILLTAEALALMHSFWHRVNTKWMDGWMDGWMDEDKSHRTRFTYQNLTNVS